LGPFNLSRPTACGLASSYCLFLCRSHCLIEFHLWLCLPGWLRKSLYKETFQALINSFFYSGQIYKWARVIGKVFHLTVQRSLYERCIDGPLVPGVTGWGKQEIGVCWLVFCHVHTQKNSFRSHFLYAQAPLI
jgi:hypothetical protein